VKEFVIAREYDAPRARVWQAWTDAERLKHWWGPKGFKIISCEVDLRPGGMFLYGMQSPNGQEIWGRFIYREVVRPERLVFVVSFSDRSGGITRHPWSENWPLEILSTVLFEDLGAKTRVTVKWLPHDATDIERKTFDEGRDSMKQGWTGTLDQLESHLAK
jgi:uncharacterized protein YndB with AHSA1/START domain